MHKIIDNALSQETFEGIKNFVLNSNFPWNLVTEVVGPQGRKEKKNIPITASYYFTHLFWKEFHFHYSLYTGPQSQIFAPILDLLDYNAIIRIKGNLYPSTETIVHHEDHNDCDFPHRGAIFYLNTNNGFTVLEDDIKIESIENRLLLFDPSIPHHSTTCTDNKCRVNINFNFF